MKVACDGGSCFSPLALQMDVPNAATLAPTAPPTQRQHGPLSHEHQQPRSACSPRQLGQAKRWGEGQVFARTGNRCLQVSSLDYGPIGSYQHFGGGSLKSIDGRQILSVDFCGLHFATTPPWPEPGSGLVAQDFVKLARKEPGQLIGS